MLHFSVFNPIQSSVNPLNPVSTAFLGGLACFSLSILVLLFFNLELNPQSLFGLRLEVTRSQGAHLDLLLQCLPLVSSKLAIGTQHRGAFRMSHRNLPGSQFPIYKAIFRNENERKKKFQQALLYLDPGFPSPRRWGQRSKGIFTISPPLRCDCTIYASKGVKGDVVGVSPPLCSPGESHPHRVTGWALGQRCLEVSLSLERCLPKQRH